MEMKKCFVIMLLVVFALSMLVTQVSAVAEILRVQGPVVGTGQGAPSNPTFLSMNSSPVVGNVLIATIGMTTYGMEHVAGISQTGVLWYKAVNSSITGVNSEIWYGIVWTSASVDITVALTSYAYAMVVTVCEYSGIAVSGVLDVTAFNLGNEATSDTGTTNVTAVAGELWIGTIACTLFSGSNAQSNVTNGFVFVSNSTVLNQDSSYLEKIVSVNGTANTGTSIVEQYQWSGCVATFKMLDVVPTPTLSPVISSGGIELFGYVFVIVMLIISIVLMIRVIPIVNFIVGCFDLVFAAAAISSVGAFLPFRPWSNLFLVIMAILTMWSGAHDLKED